MKPSSFYAVSILYKKWYNSNCCKFNFIKECSIMSGGLIISLQQIINNSHIQSDIDYKISEYLLKNLKNNDLTITEISKYCHVSKASVTRFAQNIGYDGFNGLKSDLEIVPFERDELKLDFKAKTNQDNEHKLTHELKKEFN